MTPAMPPVLDPDLDGTMDRAARHLLAGHLVAFPTETVYGLGADAENPAAVARIYAAKQRPAGHPLIVHLAPDADISYWTPRLSAQARALVDAFWPGPLTLIVERAAHIPDDVSGGQPTIGLRCPSHPVAQRLLSRFAGFRPGGQGGVAAPSANRFGHVSPTRAEHVRAEFPGLSPAELLILEGGPSTVGIESTILDVSGDDGSPPVLLRPGHIGPDQIAAVLGRLPASAHADSPQVSGTLKAHYAPRTPLILVSTDQLPAVLARHARSSPPAAAMVFAGPANRLPSIDGLDYIHCDPDPENYARNLYDRLRRADAGGYSLLILEQPPQDAIWQAVNDRLGRAAAAFDTDR